MLFPEAGCKISARGDLCASLQALLAWPSPRLKSARGTPGAAPWYPTVACEAPQPAAAARSGASEAAPRDRARRGPGGHSSDRAAAPAAAARL